MTETVICVDTLCKEIAHHFLDQPTCDSVKEWIAPVEVEDELMGAHDDRLAEEARDVAAEVMPTDAQMRQKVVVSVARLHDTLHRTPSERLARMLQRSVVHVHVVQAARENKCDACSRGETRSNTARSWCVQCCGRSCWLGRFFGNTRTLKRKNCVCCSWTKGRVILCRSVCKR